MPDSDPRPLIRYFGDYTLLGIIARGGMGIVWQATHTALGRSCALKVIATGPVASPMERGRFLAEAEAVASLDHPNIVRVRHAGECEGQFFLEMELVEGGTLAERLEEGALPPIEAAELLMPIARAVHHAHERGVLHRDLKPGNVLLASDGTPKLADFGIAKFLARSPELTSTFAILGTPAYLAPEVARGGARDATVTSDVYSLGAILFELLTRRPPFVGKTAVDILCQVQDTLPPHPRTIDPAIPADLEVICLRSLDPDPARRFPSAGHLADDLKRFLGGEPIQSRSVSSVERLWRWSRRHPSVALATSTALAAMIIGGGLVTWQWRRAEHLNYRLLRDLTANRLTEAQAELDQGKTAIGLARLVRAAKAAPWHSGARQMLQSRLQYGDLIAPVATVWRHSNDVESAEFTSEGARILAIGAEGRGRLFDVASQRVLLDVALFKNGSRFVISDTNGGVVVVHTDSGALQQWWVTTNATGGAPGWSLPGVQVNGANNPHTHCAAVDAAGRVWVGALSSTNLPTNVGYIVAASRLALDSGASKLASVDTNGAVTLWSRGVPDAALPSNPDSPITVQSLPSGGIPLRLLEFSPNDRWLIGLAATNIFVWDVVSGKLSHNRVRHSGKISDVCFSQDSKWIATASYDDSACVWKSDDGSRVGEALKHPSWAICVRFSPDGKLLATCSDDGLVRLFATDNWRRITGSATHELYANTVEFAPNGQTLLTASADGTARVWRLPQAVPKVETSVAGAIKAGVVAVPHNELAILSSSGELDLWDWRKPATNRARLTVMSGASVFAWLPALDQFAVGGNGTSGVQFVSRTTSQVSDLHLSITNAVTQLTADARGDRLLVGTQTHAWLYDLHGATPRLITDFDFPRLRSAAFSRNAKLLAVGSYDSFGRILDAVSGVPLGEQFDAAGPIQTVRFSPDSTKLLTASFAKAARVWDVSTGRPLTPPLRHKAEATAGDFSSDGRQVATGGGDEAHVWETATGLELQAFQGISGYVRRVEFSPDNETLLVSTTGGQVQLFDVMTGLEISGNWDVQIPGSPRERAYATFAPGGETILAWTDSGRVHAFAWPKPPRLDILLEMGDWLSGRRFDDAGVLHLLTDSEISALRLRLEATERRGDLPAHLARYLR